MKKDDASILLESGTNELEILEFCLAKSSYGINVSKVRELLQYQTVQRIPQAQPFVEGIFCPRKEIYTVVDLAGYLNFPASENPTKDILIITHFNQLSTAFHVHGVESIHRISWEAIEKPNSSIFGGIEGIVTGIARIDGRMIPILDFEKIMCDINPGSSIEASFHKLDKERVAVDNTLPILIAEDSMVLRKMILESLHKAGYQNVEIKENGQEAWDYLCQIKDSGKSVLTQVACLITDIEMPVMDGHHLTKRVKEDKALSSIPVVIFSSMITPEMEVKGREVGADAQLSKPEIDKLVDTLDRLTQQKK